MYFMASILLTVTVNGNCHDKMIVFVKRAFITTPSNFIFITDVKKFKTMIHL